MATQIPESQMQAFYDFLGRRIEQREPELTPEECVCEFRLYQQELDRLVRETEPALVQSERGETRPLHVDRVMDRVARRLAERDTSH